ncbi:16338_t:CDS:2 [Acaulospora morrowiae]|uniref:16338_t:CDS:1 n=1 Tax=Acaulospora morrowiae TaxID=94023 RepID=A0A9N8WKJ5_9GLOM|nr:16338_t:CDS:2 [Acaulospora morrowiae]
MALFIGRLALDTHPRDLEHIFDKFGRLNRLEVKRGYAFVEYQDQRDASDAIKETDGFISSSECVATKLLLNGRRMAAKSLPKTNVSNVVEKDIGQKIVALFVKTDVGVGAQEEVGVTFYESERSVCPFSDLQDLF